MLNGIGATTAAGGKWPERIDDLLLGLAVQLLAGEGSGATLVTATLMSVCEHPQVTPHVDQRSPFIRKLELHASHVARTLAAAVFEGSFERKLCPSRGSP